MGGSAGQAAQEVGTVLDAAAAGAVARDGGQDAASAVARPLPASVLRALEGALAEAGPADGVGEDGLDPFPLPQLRAEEVRAIEAAAGVPLPPPPAAGVPDIVAVEPKGGDAPSLPEEAIARFHREIGLVPAAPAEAAEPAPEGGGSGDGGSDGEGPPAAPAGGPGRRKRRSIWDIEDRPMTIYEHLDELRRRILWAGLAFVAGTAATLPFLVHIVRAAARGMDLLAIGPIEPLTVAMKLAVLGGLVLGSPVILYQLVAYIFPALTRQERRILLTFLPAAVLLFVAGTVFGLAVVEPVVLRMARGLFPSDLVKVEPTLANWFNYTIGFSVPFGLLFELPVVVAVLARVGIVTPDTLARGRRWALLASVVVAVMFAPPLDVIVTPSLIALPLYGLYELSIQVARLAYRSPDQQDGAEA
jgi:sec-independent protein translocase protein TatC